MADQLRPTIEDPPVGMMIDIAVTVQGDGYPPAPGYFWDLLPVDASTALERRGYTWSIKLRKWWKPSNPTGAKNA